MDGEAINCRPFELRRKPRRWRRTLAMFVLMLSALSSGTGNAAVSGFGDDIKKFGHVDANTWLLLTSVGLLGTMFTVPAGWALDRAGSFWTHLLGGSMASGGYLMASYGDGSSAGLSYLFTGFLLMLFGSGMCFTTVLRESMSAMPASKGLAVSLVGSCFSLSQAAVVLVIHIYNSSTSCGQDGPNCWRYRSRTQLHARMSSR